MNDPTSTGLPILYRDDRLVAVHKPAGLLVHRTDLDRHETRFAVQMLRDQLGLKVWPAHRLDRGTSGVLIFALDSEIAGRLGRQFEDGSVHKEYLAVVRGHPPAAGTIDHPLARRPDDREVAPGGTGAQAAITHYQRLATTELPVAVDRYPSSRYALIALQPVTGRRHQLRRHLKHLSHPIIGDATYGKGRHNRFFASHLGCPRLLLACTRLALRHPEDGRALDLRALPDVDFLSAIHALGWAPALRQWLDTGHGQTRVAAASLN
ncbi:MAG: pseudouridylate synthase [Zoogloeaceae bacterium]|nr:pseudouridylate synthase [Zoogloeaceae bacterium]